MYLFCNVIVSLCILLVSDKTVCVFFEMGSLFVIEDLSVVFVKDHLSFNFAQ